MDGLLHRPTPASQSHQVILAEERRRARPVQATVVVAAVGVLLSMQATGLLDRQRLAEGGPAIAQLAREMWPPDFERWQAWLQPLQSTLAMSVAGTGFAVLLSVPLAFLAARATTPHPAVYTVARLVLNALRSVPELIMGIVLVAAVGFGALPGVLALGLHSVGMIGKFFAETFEHVDPRPIEAAMAAGATRAQAIRHGLLPQALPQMADVAVYRWEYNFRASTVLGAVGAGGIGFELINALRLLDYAQVAALLLVILLCVTLVDAAGSALRRLLA